MNATPTSCSSGRLRSTAARIAAGVAAMAPIGCRSRRPARIVARRGRPGAFTAAALVATVRLQHRPIRRRQSSWCGGRWRRDAPALFRLAPYSSSSAEQSPRRPRARPRAAARRRPRATATDRRRTRASSFGAPAPRRRCPLAMTSAERRSSDRALTSAPASSSDAASLPVSGAAHISAVAPALFAALGSAPAIEQPLHERGVAVQAPPPSAASHRPTPRGRRRARGCLRKLRVDARAVAVANRRASDAPRRRSAGGAGVLAGGGIRPHRALVDPVLG